MKSARRLVAMMLAMLMVFALFSGCSNQDAVVEDDTNPVVSDAVVSDTVVSEADAAVEDEAAPVDEAASGESANSDVTMDLMLYLIETETWANHNSRETVSVTPDGGTFTFSIETDWITLSRIGSMYIKDKNVNMELTGKSPFSSVSIALEKYAINGVEFDVLKDANGNLLYEEAISSNGVFDYAFVNMWWTDGLKLTNCEPIHVGGPYAFTGTELNTDDTNLFELTFSIKPVDSANILDAKDIRRELRGLSLNSVATSTKVGETVTLNCSTWPAVCERDIYNFQSRVNWTSSDPSIATVSNGVVTAVAEGTAIITASFDGFSTSCAVSVLSDAPASIVKLYATMGNGWPWPTASSEAAVIDKTGEYTFSITDSKDNMSGFITLYLKDVDAEAGTSDSTTYPNVVIDFKSVSLNGTELDLSNNTDLWDWSGKFNFELLNIWSEGNNKIDVSQDDSVYGYEFTEDAYVDGDNTLDVVIEVTDLDKWN